MMHIPDRYPAMHPPMITSSTRVMQERSSAQNNIQSSTMHRQHNLLGNTAGTEKISNLAKFRLLNVDRILNTFSLRFYRCTLKPRFLNESRKQSAYPYFPPLPARHYLMQRSPNSVTTLSMKIEEVVLLPAQLDWEVHADQLTSRPSAVSSGHHCHDDQYTFFIQTKATGF